MENNQTNPAQVKHTYSLKDLNEEDKQLFNKYVEFVAELDEQMIYLNSLVTEAEEEDFEKFQYLVTITLKREQVAATIVERFYNKQD